MKENLILSVTIPTPSSSAPIKSSRGVSCHSLHLTFFEGCHESLASLDKGNVLPCSLTSLRCKIVI